MSFYDCLKVFSLRNLQFNENFVKIVSARYICNHIVLNKENRLKVSSQADMRQQKMEDRCFGARVQNVALQKLGL